METYLDQMFNYTSAVTTLTQMYAGTSSSQGTYSPKANGTLVNIFITVTPQAASSLCQEGYVTLACTNWMPVNTLTIPFVGWGLQTVPAYYNNQPFSYPVALPVNTALPITGNVIEFFSPVTPNVVVWGAFTA